MTRGKEPAAGKEAPDLKMRYLGVLGLLAECSVYVKEDTREMIEAAFTDAEAAGDIASWKRVLDRIDPIPHLEASLR